MVRSGLSEEGMFELRFEGMSQVIEEEHTKGEWE